jgi:hypothetical protein
MSTWKHIFDWLRRKPTALAITPPPPPPIDAVALRAELHAYHAAKRADAAGEMRASILAAAVDEMGWVAFRAWRDWQPAPPQRVTQPDVPTAVQEIIGRGVAEARAHEERHCLWMMSALPLPENPFLAEPDDAWAAEIERRMTAMYQHADVITLNDMERRAAVGTLRLEVDVIAPPKLMWQRLAREDCADQQRRFARIVGGIIAEVMDVAMLRCVTSTKIHIMDGRSSYGWSFGLYDDDAEGLVA